MYASVMTTKGPASKEDANRVIDHRFIVVAVVLGALATGILALDMISPLPSEARHPTLSPALGDSSRPTPEMFVAIRNAVAVETSGTMQVDRIDYVGRHDNGAGSVAYIFYIYFADASGLEYERFVRVLRTSDGTLQVLAA